MTLAITPKYTTSTLIISVQCGLSSTATGHLVAALFQDSTANALAVGAHNVANTGAYRTVTLQHSMTAGTTAATTFKIRAGNNSAGTTTFNGSTGARLFGGSILSSIIIQEIKG